MATIECDTCGRDATSGKDFLCVCCARSSIYLARLESAKALVEKHDLGKQIENATAPLEPASKLVKPKDHTQFAWRDETANIRKVDTRARIEQTKSHIAILRQEMENTREEIAKQKADLIDRRRALQNITAAIRPRQQDTLGAISEARNKGTTSFGTVNKNLISTRAFLCRETSTLLRLRCKKRMKDGAVQEQYSVTGMILPDLRDINTMRCTDLSAVLNSTAHLLTLISFYLGIRLPAEITTPHRNYPLATINTPANSYLGVRIAFPGSGSISTAPSSPFSSKHDIKYSHRPRPLFIGSDDRDEKVAQFAKRDPSAFNFFVEGISLLAWNAAWLSRSQGFTTGTKTWEEICNTGRILCNLLAAPQSPAMQRILSDRDARKHRVANQASSSPPTTSTISPSSGTSTPLSGVPSGKLASTSHHTCHADTLLSLPPNQEHLKTWKFSKWPVVSDALKKHLVTEMTNAEWELLQEQEWDDGGEIFDAKNAITIGAVPGNYIEAGSGRAGVDPAQDRKVLNDATQSKNRDGRNSTPASDADTAGTKARGSSGWTKVRGRDR